MTTHAATIGWRPRRAFWLGLVFIDLILLVFLAEIPWVALVLGLGVATAALILRVEWLIAFLLLGMPFLAPLPLAEDAFTVVLLLLRALFLFGWWISLGSAGRAADPPRGRSATALACVARVARDPRTITMLLLAMVIWIGLGWSEAPRYGASKVIALVLGNLFLFLAPFLLWMRWVDPRSLDRFLRAGILLGAIFAAFGIAAALGFAEQLSFGALVRVQLITKERLAWLGVSQIWTARMLAVWLILVLWGAQRRLLQPLAAALLVIVALLLIARTGSRGPLAALLLSPLALLLLPRRRAAEGRAVASPDPERMRRPGVRHRSGASHRAGGLRRLLPAALPVVLLSGLLVLVALPDDDRAALIAGLLRGPIGVALSTSDLGEGVADAVGVRLAQDPSTIHRMHLAQRSLASLEEVLPWGAGTGGFPALLFMRDFRLYPHNIFAELLIENGWPGLLLFLLFLFLTWRAAWWLARRSTGGRWLFVLFAMALLNAQVSGDIGTNEWIWLWAGMIAGHRVAGGRHPDMGRER